MCDAPVPEIESGRHERFYILITQMSESEIVSLFNSVQICKFKYIFIWFYLFTFLNAIIYPSISTCILILYEQIEKLSKLYIVLLYTIVNVHLYT